MSSNEVSNEKQSLLDVASGLSDKSSSNSDEPQSIHVINNANAIEETALIEHAEGSSVTRSLMIVVLFATISGFLFGYDSGVVSGALVIIRPEFKMSPFEAELFVSITMFGAAIASPLGGKFADINGRRRAIGVGALLFTIGGVILSATPDSQYWMLVVGRFVVGLGIGLSSSIVPLYVAELSPPRHRGKLVT